jgi:hypothetical protein
MCDDQDRKESTAKSKPLKGQSPAVISHKSSSEEKFQIGDREKALLKDLFDWSERSSETHWVLGKPLGAQG